MGDLVPVSEVRMSKVKVVKSSKPCTVPLQTRPDVHPKYPHTHTHTHTHAHTHTHTLSLSLSLTHTHTRTHAHTHTHTHTHTYTHCVEALS